jgi:transposase InsO family protein
LISLTAEAGIPRLHRDLAAPWGAVKIIASIEEPPLIERVRRRICLTRDKGRQDVFDYIEFVYSLERKHGSNNMRAPIEFERHYCMRQQAV